MQLPKTPLGLKWRSHTGFIIATVAIGLFTDLFLYGIVVPVVPFLLEQRVHVPPSQIQSYTSILLAVYAAASVVFSLPAGWLADRSNSRQTPFLAGLVMLLAATILLAVGQTVAVLIVARILQGISAAVVWTVGLAMVLDTVGPEDLGKVLGSIFSFISVGELLAPVLGGILYDKAGYAGVFGLSTAVLAIDFILRLLVVEKKTAAKYGLETGSTNPLDHNTRNETSASSEAEDATEETGLLGKTEEEDFKIPEGQNRLVQSLPILYCLSNARVLVGLFMSFVQASLLGMFSATIPTEASSLLGFTSLDAGLLFIALDIPYLFLGPVIGWACDRYGTKPVAVIGLSYLVPALILLRLPTEGLVHGQRDTIILWCGILALNGIGMGAIGSPSLVEVSDVVQRYHKANEGFFGKNGPYAQLYGFESMVFSAGLTLGPLISGTLRDRIGYGNMSAVFAALAGVSAILSFLFIGGKPKSIKKLARMHNIEP